MKGLGGILLYIGLTAVCFPLIMSFFFLDKSENDKFVQKLYRTIFFIGIIVLFIGILVLAIK